MAALAIIVIAFPLGASAALPVTIHALASPLTVDMNNRGTDMALLDFPIAPGPLVRTADGRAPRRSPFLGDAKQACRDALPQNAGSRFTAALQRSWREGRAVNAGLLAVSIMRDDARRRLLAAWVNSGGVTSSFFAVAADALLDSIANQLPDPSQELAVCRLEQLILRAHDKAGPGKTSERTFRDPQGVEFV